MEIIKNAYKILEPFTKTPWESLTFKQIKELSKNKSDNYVHTNLKQFVKHKFLQEEKIGNAILYSPARNTYALNMLGYIAEHRSRKAAHLPHKNLQKITDKLKTAYYSFIITGSYARKKQKKSSDIDIVIICDDKQNPDAILTQIKLESELMMPEVHPYVFTQTQLFTMLTNKEENYGKELARNNMIITGGKQFYAIIMEAIQHGFNG